MAEKNMLIRQEREYPDDWHVAAQGITPPEMLEKAIELAKQENQKFGVTKGGDVVGNNTFYYILNSEDFQNNG